MLCVTGPVKYNPSTKFAYSLEIVPVLGAHLICVLFCIVD